MQDVNLISGYIDINGAEVFDIGCGKGIFSNFFIDKGANVFAIDKVDGVNSEVKKRDNFTFNLGDIDTLSINKKYDIIFSRNVFSFCNSSLTDILNKLKHSLNVSGVFFFTYFGDREEWGMNEKVKTLKREEIDAVLENFKYDFDIKYFAEELFEGKAMDGSIKNWHIFRIILKRK